MNEQHVSYERGSSATIESMLCGEIAAVESYNLAIGSLHDDDVRVELERMRDRHQGSVCSLRRWAQDLQETSGPGSGVWGFFACAITRLAALAGDRALLAALRRGERRCEAAYRVGLGDPELPDEFRHLIGAKLLPQCQERLHRLERIAGKAEATSA